MTPIRALEADDLPAIAALYAELERRDPASPAPGYIEFFRRTLLEPPLANPEAPSLVYTDSSDGVVGVIGSHPRHFMHGDREVLLACSGPLIVRPTYRERGVGALLLRRFAAGPQDMSFNDRSIDAVQMMWRRFGASTDTAASIGWRRVLAPAGAALSALAWRVGRRRSPPGGAAVAALDALGGRRFRSPLPPSGEVETLSSEAMLDLVSGLQRQYTLRPAYDRAFLDSLFKAMDRTVLGDRLVRRLVRDGDGRSAGAYVMQMAAHGTAYVLGFAAGYKDAGLVFDHLIHDATRQGAVELSGRVEAALLPHLLRQRCRLEGADWVTVLARDPLLVNAVLSGQALVSRMDGEWWMRPRPELP